MTRSHRSGFTLIEVTCVMIVVGVLAALGVTLITICQQGHRITNQQSQSMNRVNELAKSFRSDVRNAQNTLRTYGVYKSGDHCLILNMDQEIVIVYEWIEEQLWRTEFRGGNRRQMALLLPHNASSVTFQTNGNLATIRITLPSQHHQSRVSELTANLSGNRR